MAGLCEVVQQPDGSDAQPDLLTCRKVLGTFCTGITVLTADLDGEPVGMTCQAFTSLSLDPPRVLLCPATTSLSWPKIQQADTFCVNVLASHQEPLSQAFARSGADKFAGVPWSHGTTGAPRLDGAVAWIECRIESASVVGDHHVVIGRILDIDDEVGRDPLLYFRGQYAAMAQESGPFAYAAG